MASFDDLAHSHTRLEGSALAHLRRLIASWGLLADFCFADLLLYAPVAGADGSKFVVLGQIRPTTSQTLYREDQMGRVIDEVERPLVARAWRLGQMIDGEISLAARGERARIQCIPVRWKGAMLGVLTRESALLVGRRPGELERVYVEIFDRFARMITTGEFPYGAVDTETEEAPRVGDGVMLLDAAGRVSYVSPNVVSAFHRLGMHANAEGARLGELGFEDSTVRAAFAMGLPFTEEIEKGTVTALVRAIPLLENGRIDGAVVLMRDVTDLRRRDRELISKDATIREIHHRVKNNLQTISSLLRLQGRRLASPEARVAIEESVRRIRSIALVHELLSKAAGDQIPFNEIVRELGRMVEEGLSSPDRSLRFRVEGDAGELRAEVATPLAVVLTELLQNAIEHGFTHDREWPDGQVVISLRNDGTELVALVADNGAGLPPGFSLERTSSLGLTIVRTLVTSELAGTIRMTRGIGPDDHPGTTVELRLPAAPLPRVER